MGSSTCSLGSGLPGFTACGISGADPAAILEANRESSASLCTFEVPNQALEGDPQVPALHPKGFVQNFLCETLL